MERQLGDKLPSHVDLPNRWFIEGRGMFSSRPAQTTITGSSPSLWQYLNPLHLTRNLWHHRYLILQLTRREIEGRYKGSFLGLFWSFINPLVLLLIYTFVFGIVFKARWPNARVGNLGEFAITL